MLLSWALIWSPKYWEKAPLGPPFATNLYQFNATTNTMASPELYFIENSLLDISTQGSSLQSYRGRENQFKAVFQIGP